jgi:hypothetical protein
MMDTTTNANFISRPLADSSLRDFLELSGKIVKGSANLNIRNQQHISFEAPHQKPNLELQNDYSIQIYFIKPSLKIFLTTLLTNPKVLLQ